MKKLVEVYRVTEWRDGAVYKTEFVEERWVPMEQEGSDSPSEIFAAPKETDVTKIFRR